MVCLRLVTGPIQVPLNNAILSIDHLIYSKTCLKLSLKMTLKLGFNTNYRLMQVNNIAECSKGSILQYFRLSLSYLLL